MSKKSVSQETKPSFKTITEDELKKAYKYQQDVGHTFNDSKDLADATLNNRFNFLLLAYSLFLNAYFIVTTPKDKLTILVIGFLINLFLSIGIFRAHTRYNLVIDILRSLDNRETTSIILKELKTKK